MSAKRVIVAAVAGFVTFFFYGGLVFGKLLANDYRPYTNVYRSMDQMQQHMAVGMLSSIAALLVLAVMYAKGYEGGSGAAEGARFGLLVGISQHARTSPTIMWSYRSGARSRPRWRSQAWESGRWSGW